MAFVAPVTASLPVLGTANEAAFLPVQDIIAAETFARAVVLHDYVVLESALEFFENSFRSLAISSLDRGQLQWNTMASDFNASSNSSCLNVTVWL